MVYISCCRPAVVVVLVRDSVVAVQSLPLLVMDLTAPAPYAAFILRSALYILCMPLPS